jgi:flagellin-like hook-associated protein FlgL
MRRGAARPDTTEVDMGLSVINNVPALIAHRSLTSADDAMTRSLERLSSGNRINRAADDAAGLAISQNLRAQITGAGQAIRNTQDGISVVRTADGALGSATALLQRMRDLAVQAANDGGLSTPAKKAIQLEMSQLKSELTRIGSTTTFNGRPLLDGNYRGTFQVGANAGESLTVVIGSVGQAMDTAGLGLTSVDVTGTTSLVATVTGAIADDQGVPLGGGVDLAGDFTSAGVYPASFAGLAGSISYDGKTFDLSTVDYTGAVTATDYLNRLNAAAQPFFGVPFTPFTGSATQLMFSGAVPAVGSTAADAARLTPTYAGQSGASGAIPLLDDAVEVVSSMRAYLGAFENRFEHAIAGLNTTMENTMASVSRISDTDMAWEMAAFSRSQILSQVGTAMLAQADKTPQGVLALLQ